MEIDFHENHVSQIKVMLQFKKEFQLFTAFFLLFFSAQAYAEVIPIVDDLHLKGSDKQSQSAPYSLKTNTKSTSISISPYSLSSNLDQDNYTASAEVWSKNKWGLSAKIEEASKQEESILEKTELTRIDINKKLLTSKKSDSYLALGMGWQGFDINKKKEAEGVNFSLLGKLALKNNILFYGSGGLYKGSNSNEDKAYSLEAGLKYKIDSNLSVSAGLKLFDVDNLNLNEKEQSSFLIGTQLKF